MCVSVCVRCHLMCVGGWFVRGFVCASIRSFHECEGVCDCVCVCECLRTFYVCECVCVCNVG